MRKARKLKNETTAAAVVSLPRLDVTDDDLISAVAEKGGLPTRVAQKFGMSLTDLMARAKASPKVCGAFMEAQQSAVDNARAHAYRAAIGAENGVPDPALLRWFIERYERPL